MKPLRRGLHKSGVSLRQAYVRGFEWRVLQLSPLSGQHLNGLIGLGRGLVNLHGRRCALGGPALPA